MLDQDTLARLTSYFAERNDITAVFLYGSRARGDARADSDVDLGILLAPDQGRTWGHRSALITDLMRLCGRPDVNVVILNSAPPLLLHRVLRDGHVLYAASDAVVAEFSIRAFQQYEDTRPLRELQAERLRRQLTNPPIKGGGAP